MLEQFKDIEKEMIFIEGIENTNIDSKNEAEKSLNELLKKYEKHIQDLIQLKKIDIIAHEMIENIILVKTLKEKNITLSDKQQEDNKTFLELLKKILEKMKNQAILVNQINNLEIYIDSNIMEILKIEETVETISEIILYNKKVLDKKNGVYIKEEIKEKQEEKIIEEPKRIETSKKKKKREKKPTFEMLIFETVEELQDTVKKEFNVDVPDDLYGNNFYEMIILINLLRTKVFKGIKNETNLIEQILKYSNMDIIKDISDILEQTSFNSNDLLEIKNVFFSKRCEEVEGNYEEMSNYLRQIDICPFLTTKEKKLEILKMKKRKIEMLKNNTIILLSYKAHIFNDINLLTRRTSLEYLDQIIECGMNNVLNKDPRIFFYYYDMPSVEGANSRPLDKALKVFYSHLIDGLGYSDDTLEQVSKVINARKGAHIILDAQKISSVKLSFSKNEVLNYQSEINKLSKERIGEILSQGYIEENIYINYLEEEYLMEQGLAYAIPISLELSKSGYILISRNKMIRLINEHILERHEITPLIIKECMLYNLIITDEILEEFNKNITEIFGNITSMQKKI